MSLACLPTQSNLSAVVLDDSDPLGTSIAPLIHAHEGTALVVDENGTAYFAQLVIVIDITRARADWSVRRRVVMACTRAWSRGRKDIADRMNTYADAVIRFAPTA